jgi:hypothetical protein
VVLFAGLITEIDLSGADPLSEARALAQGAETGAVEAETALAAYRRDLRALGARVREAGGVVLLPLRTPTAPEGERLVAALRERALAIERAGAERLAPSQLALVAELRGRAEALAAIAVEERQASAARAASDQALAAFAVRTRRSAAESDAFAALGRSDFPAEIVPLRFDLDEDGVLAGRELERLAAAMETPRAPLAAAAGEAVAASENGLAILPDHVETLARLEAETARARDWAERTREALRAAQVDAVRTGRQQAQSTEALIASAVTRFGVIAVLIFLAQALINLYRYALRLSAFYRSRAVTLALAGGDPERLDAFARCLSADHVTLGREPQPPMEQVREAARIVRDLKP